VQTPLKSTLRLSFTITFVQEYKCRKVFNGALQVHKTAWCLVNAINNSNECVVFPLSSFSYSKLRKKQRLYLKSEWELGWLSQYSVWLQIGRTVFDPRQSQRIFPLASVFRQPTSYSMGQGGPFPGGKVRLGRDAEHSTPSSAKEKISRSYRSYFLVACMAVVGQLLKSELLTAMKMALLVFWVATACWLIIDTNVSEKHIVSIFRAGNTVYSKRWNLPASPHGITTQLTSVDRIKIVRISKSHVCALSVVY
jgi:hypothetical protein